jgi:hypothetical protein
MSRSHYQGYVIKLRLSCFLVLVHLAKRFQLVASGRKSVAVGRSVVTILLAIGVLKRGEMMGWSICLGGNAYP